jgi:hypothetical protein
MAGHRLRWRVLLMIGLGISQICALAAGAPEYQVKAAFLYKFATYVRWPVSAGTDASGPFVFGVLGSNPFGSSLDDVVRAQTVRGRSIRIRTLTRADQALACDLVFVSSSERSNLGPILAILRGAPVLTVGDMNRFAEQGGMIGLVTTGDHRIRFDINQAAIERSGLRASSQLLHLARIVDEAGNGGGQR